MQRAIPSIVDLKLGFPLQDTLVLGTNGVIYSLRRFFSLSKGPGPDQRLGCAG
jgi:hypothetical protein